jgi:hypothetical protein
MGAAITASTVAPARRRRRPCVARGVWGWAWWGTAKRAMGDDVGSHGDPPTLSSGLLYNDSTYATITR